MSAEQLTNKTQERKKLLKNDLKEGLEGLKEILVSTITLLFRISESIPKAKLSSSLISFKSINKKAKDNSALSFVQNNPKSTNSKAVDVSVEIHKEKSLSFSLNKLKEIIYPILAIASTAALITGVHRMGPLMEWAKTQNECINSTTSIDGITPEDLTTKVMKCNGGHAF